MDIPCDFCLENFENANDFEIHLAEMHQNYPSFCILCFQYFSPGTRRATFERHIAYECFHSFKQKIYKQEIPVARNLKCSFSNKKTNHWIYVKGRRYFLVHDERLLYKTDEERKCILSFLNVDIPKILPSDSSPIIHYSSPYVFHFKDDDSESSDAVSDNSVENVTE